MLCLFRKGFCYKNLNLFLHIVTIAYLILRYISNYFFEIKYFNITTITRTYYRIYPANTNEHRTSLRLQEAKDKSFFWLVVSPGYPGQRQGYLVFALPRRKTSLSFGQSFLLGTQVKDQGTQSSPYQGERQVFLLARKK